MNGESNPPAYSPAPSPQKKGGLSTGCIVALVIGILLLVGGVVAVILIGVFGGPLVIKKARMLQAKVTMMTLDVGIKGFNVEYQSLPHPGAALPTTDNAAYDSTDANGKAVLEVLLGTGVPEQNPRQTHFWDAPPAKTGNGGYTPTGGLTDPWGNPYKIILDYDKDGKIEDPQGVSGKMSATTLMYSAGPDGDFSTWSDNVCSWR